jgi:membrane-associated phospholipid phosphatase
VNAFDRAVVEALGHKGLHPERLHGFVQGFLVHSDLLKGGLLVASLWWLWMQPHEDQRRRREVVVVAIMASMAAALLSRAFANLVPFRGRPFETPGFDLAMIPANTFETKGGSFPSDHLALAFALVAGVFVLRRRVGVALGAYTLLVVGLPRMYLGIHWATDIIGGALFGIAAFAVLGHPRLRAPIAGKVLSWMHRWPGAFYATLFLISFGLMTRFEGFRLVASYGLHAVQRALHLR